MSVFLSVYAEEWVFLCIEPVETEILTDYGEDSGSYDQRAMEKLAC
jgi:hypothetical protein